MATFTVTHGHQQKFFSVSPSTSRTALQLQLQQLFQLPAPPVALREGGVAFPLSFIASRPDLVDSQSLELVVAPDMYNVEQRPRNPTPMSHELERILEELQLSGKISEQEERVLRRQAHVESSPAAALYESYEEEVHEILQENRPDKAAALLAARDELREDLVLLAKEGGHTVDDADRGRIQSERQGGAFTSSEVQALLSLLSELVNGVVVSRAEARHLRTLVRLPHSHRETVRSLLYRAAQALAAGNSTDVAAARQLRDIVALRNGVQSWMAGRGWAGLREDEAADTPGSRATKPARVLQDAAAARDSEVQGLQEGRQSPSGGGLGHVLQVVGYVVPRMVARFRGRGDLTTEEAKATLSLLKNHSPVLLAATSLYVDTGDEAEFIDTLRRLLQAKMEAPGPTAVPVRAVQGTGIDRQQRPSGVEEEPDSPLLAIMDDMASNGDISLAQFDALRACLVDEDPRILAIEDVLQSSRDEGEASESLLLLSAVLASEDGRRFDAGADGKVALSLGSGVGDAAPLWQRSGADSSAFGASPVSPRNDVGAVMKLLSTLQECEELPKCTRAHLMPKVFAMAKAAHVPLFRAIDAFLDGKDASALDSQLFTLAAPRRGSTSGMGAVPPAAAPLASPDLPSAAAIPLVDTAIDAAAIDDIVRSGWVPRSMQASVQELLYAYSRWQRLGAAMSPSDAAAWATRRLHLTGAALQVWEASQDTEDLCDTLCRIVAGSPSAATAAAITGAAAHSNGGPRLSANQKTTLRDAGKALHLSSHKKSTLERLIRSNDANLLAAAEVYDDDHDFQELQETLSLILEMHGGSCPTAAAASSRGDRESQALSKLAALVASAGLSTRQNSAAVTALSQVEDNGKDKEALLHGLVNADNEEEAVQAVESWLSSQQ